MQWVVTVLCFWACFIQCFAYGFNRYTAGARAWKAAQPAHVFVETGEMPPYDSKEFSPWLENYLINSESKTPEELELGL
jgi:hypothetical protein